MTSPSLEALLRRVRIRPVSDDALVGYTAEVRRRLTAAPTPARPRLQWWPVVVPLGAAALLLTAIVTRPTFPPTSLSEVALAHEAALLSVLAPEEPLLPDDDALLDDLAWLEELSS